MSQLAVNSVTDANGGNTATINSMTPTADSLQGFRNRIINGDMRIDQRNAGASVSPTTTTYTLDRWTAVMNATGAKYSVQQTPSATETGYAVRVGAGFQSYLAVTSLGAYTVGAGEIMAVQQIVEGFNIADLAWGTANAKTVTLSFWVYSSLTGTFGGAIRQGSGARSYPFTYNISSANTWEQKSITIAGDTSGTYATNNTAGLILSFGFGVGATFSSTAGSWQSGNFVSATGATSVVGTNGATFYITGVQLEVGSVATPFERRPYGTELMLCQRYCVNYRSADGGIYYRYGSGYNLSTVSSEITIDFPVSMRTSPSLTVTSTASNYAIYTAGAIKACSVLPTLDTNAKGILSATITTTTASAITNGDGSSIISNNNTTSYMLFTAEL
jgi:hypothetical protein